MKPKDIINAVKLHFHEEITYETAKRARQALLKDSIEMQLHQFTPTYIGALKAANPATYTFLSTNPETDHFQRVFICSPTANIHSKTVDNSLQLMALL